MKAIMKFLFGIWLCSLLIEHGFATKRTKKLPPGIDHMSYARHGPEDHFTPNLFTWVGNNRNVFSSVFFDHLSIPKDHRSDVLDFMTLPKYDDTRCNGCIVSSFCIHLKEKHRATLLSKNM